MPRSKPQQSAHARLEKLAQAAAGEQAKLREAEQELARTEAEAQQITSEIQAAYLHEDERRAGELRHAIKLAEDTLTDCQHRLAARRQRASDAAAAMSAFRVEHAEQLIAERQPEGETLATELQDALENVARLDTAWSTHAQGTNRLVAEVPGAQPRLDGGPAEHPFTSILRSLRHALSEGATVPAPIPRWQGRAAQHQQDHSHRLLRAQRQGDQRAVEDLQRQGAA
jgi:hypothetical protein